MTLQHTTHNRAFGLVYKGNPKSSNIVCCVPIRISFQSAITALKNFTVAVRLPFFSCDVMASAARLRGISRWNKDNGNSSQDSFIGDKRPKLIERPIVRSSPLSFVPGLSIQRLTNISQVFKRQRRTYCRRFVHQLSADAVVDVFLKPRFSPREPLEEPSCPTSAFGLKRCSNSVVAVTSSLQLATIPSLVGGSCCDVSSSQIDTNYLGRLACWWGVKFNRNLNVIVSTPSFDQCSAGRSLSSEQCQLIVTNGQREPNLLRHQRNAYVLVGLSISEDSSIQRDAAWTKLVYLLDGFHVAHHSTNGLANMIGFQSSCQPNRIVGQVMQLGGIAAVFALGYLQYLITSIRKSLQSAVNFLTQLYRDLELAGYRYRLSHALIILHPRCLWKALHPAPPSSPPTFGMGFPGGKTFMKFAQWALA